MECVGFVGKVVAATASASREGMTGGIQMVSSDEYPLQKNSGRRQMVVDKNVYHAPHGLGEFLSDYSTSSAAPPTIAATARLTASCDAPLDPVGAYTCTVGLPVPVAARVVPFELLCDADE